MPIVGYRELRADEALKILRRVLHDQVGSALSAMTMQLDIAARLVEVHPDESVRVLRELRDEAGILVALVRQLVLEGQVHLTGPTTTDNDADMRAEPPDPAERLRAMLNKMRWTFRDQIDLDYEVDPELSRARPEVGTAVYWIVHEAIINVLKHSEARRCRASVSVIKGNVWLQVRDDGVGLPPGGERTGPEGERTGHGITSMTERAKECMGWCVVQPGKPRGALVVGCLPLD